MDLHGKVAVVTGASAGIGAAMARALAAEGVRVFGLARRVERLRAMEADVPGFRGVECDVTDDAAVEAAFGTVQAEAGRLDVLVGNAGVGAFGAVEAADAATVSRLLDTNVRALIRTTQAALPLLRADGGGHIVNVASVAGLVGNPNLSVYNATKFAVRGLSEAWMKELRPQGIKVTCFYPGSVDTEFSGVAGTGGMASKEPMQPEDLAATLVHVLRAPARYLISEVVMRPMHVG